MKVSAMQWGTSIDNKNNKKTEIIDCMLLSCHVCVSERIHTL